MRQNDGAGVVGAVADVDAASAVGVVSVVDAGAVGDAYDAVARAPYPDALSPSHVPFLGPVRGPFLFLVPSLSVHVPSLFPSLCLFPSLSFPVLL